MRDFLKFSAKWLITFTLLFVAFMLTAQEPVQNPFEPGTTGSAVFNWYTGLYSGVLTALTYLQAVFFKKAGNVPKVAVRYILIAVCTAAIFIYLGWANGLSVFVGFIGSAITYDKVLKPLGLKTPAPINAEEQKRRPGGTLTTE